MAFVDLVVVRHRIGPLVYANLKKLPAEALPPGLLTPLALEARANAIKALRSLRSHVLVSRSFEQAGVDWMAFKGISLALKYYGDVSLRQVNDQDLWVPAERLDDARAALARLGFAWNPAETGWDAASRGPRHRDYLMRYNIQEQHRSAELGCIELHWELTEASAFFNVVVPTLAARGEMLSVGGVSSRVMSRVDLLLYLFEHGGRHGWCRLKWLADLPQLLEREALDWPLVLARAEAMGCTPSLLLGLAMARDLLGWSPPAELAISLSRSWSLRLLSGAVRTGLLEAHPPGSLPGPPGFRLFWRLQWSRMLLGNLRATCSLLWRMSLSPYDLHVVALPDRCFFMYRLARPLLFGLRRLASARS